TRCTNSVLGELSARQTTGDLTPSQFAVLEALYPIGSMKQGEVSNKVLKSTSNLTTVIDNLERDGYVRRERDAEDRRVIHVHLTEAGTSKLEAVLPNHIGALVEIFSTLSASEQETLGELCKKLGKGRESA
ncbi:MAG: MarR family winged helix-turn-helix transcriptional regulator, partial [Chloroflexota bacterium]